MPCVSAWSLADMLRVYADKYIALGQDLQELEMLAKGPTVASDMTAEEMKSLRGLFLRIRKHCQEINLKVSEKIADEMNEDFSKLRFLPWVIVGARVAELRRCFMAELSSTLCYMIVASRESFYTDDAPRFVESKTLEKFPSIKYDLTEAGKCFATERFTASVTHLMKAAEYALVSFSIYSGIQGEDRNNWNKALNLVHAKIRAKELPFDTLTHEEETYFVELEGYLRAAKTAWRNPASHIPIVFTESQARSLFEIVRVLLNFASQKLQESR
jgi:hypothetical protein